ncbi:hypothetical protein QFZ22_002596 [Streptomyces canus]|uniref:Uncharacterized protein n=1 Tax=Streptomyces canus TaxID=58343 RepID=A0AAW8FBG3_9ACTN|nr:hypothetical protein [Streptomyces canus]
MAVPCTAVADVDGEGRNGGHVRSSDGLLETGLALPEELGGAGTATNAEQLLGAGWAACFPGALRRAATLRKLRLTSTTVTAEITLTTFPSRRSLRFWRPEWPWSAGSVVCRAADVQDVEHDIGRAEIAAEVDAVGAGRPGETAAGLVDAIGCAVRAEVAECALLDEAEEGSLVVVPACAPARWDGDLAGRSKFRRTSRTPPPTEPHVRRSRATPR